MENSPFRLGSLKAAQLTSVVLLPPPGGGSSMISIWLDIVFTPAAPLEKRPNRASTTTRVRPKRQTNLFMGGLPRERKRIGEPNTYSHEGSGGTAQAAHTADDTSPPESHGRTPGC